MNDLVGDVGKSAAAETLKKSVIGVAAQAERMGDNVERIGQALLVEGGAKLRKHELMDYLKPATFILIPYLGGIPSGIVTRKELPTWYKTLKKPWFTPPPWVFPPTWTYLYASMGYASYLMYKELDNPEVNAKLPLALYGGQLTLNWIWSFVFFGQHKKGLSAAVIWTQWSLVGACIYTSHSVSPLASKLMVPLLGWLTLASGVCSWVWMNNKEDSQQDTDTG